MTQSGASPLAIYAANGFTPELVADFIREKYFVNEVATTFAGMIDYTGGLSTMADSDGVLKWAPHNGVDSPAAPATQNIVVVVGAKHTVEMTGSGSVTLSGAGSGSVTAGSPVEVTATTTTLTLTVVGTVSAMWSYRSDLGGMVDNPDTGSSYVPVQGFLPRRGNHKWNGTAWVNAGLKIEPAAATNLIPYSDLSSGWSEVRATLSYDATVSPDGTTNATLLTEDTTPNNSRSCNEFVNAPSITSAVVFSVYLKRNGRRYTQLRVTDDAANVGGSVNAYDVVVDLQTAAITDTGTNLGTVSVPVSGVEDIGNGWVRAYIGLTKFSGSVRTDVSVFLSNIPSYSANPTYTGDGVSGAYIYGAQLEVGSVPSSYMPTNGAEATRIAQTASIAGAKMPAYTNAVSIALKGDMTGATATPVQWQADASNLIKQSAASSTFTFAQETAGTLDTVVGGSFTAGVNTAFNIASRHGSTFINGAADGTALTADTTPTAITDLSATAFKIADIGPMSIAQVLVWPEDIGNTGIEEASA